MLDTNSVGAGQCMETNVHGEFILTCVQTSATQQNLCRSVQCDSVFGGEYACATAYDEFAGNELCLPDRTSTIVNTMFTLST